MATPEALQAREGAEVPESIRQLVALCAELSIAASDYAAEVVATGQQDMAASGNIARITVAVSGLMSALQQARMASAQTRPPGQAL